MALTYDSVIPISGGNETSQSSTVITYGASCLAGKLIVVSVAIDNRSTADGVTNDVTSITDTQGNTYTKAGEFTNTVGGAAADGATIAVFYSVLTTGVTGGTDSITVNYSGNVTAKVVRGFRFSKGAGTTIAIGGSVQTLANDNADAGSMSLSSLTNLEYLFYRAIASETDNATISTVTTSYTSPSNNVSGTGGSEKGHMAVSTEFRILTGTGDTSDPTMSDTTADRASVYLALKEVAANAVASPDTGVLDATGLAPVIDLKIAAGLGAVTATGFAPTVAINLPVAAGLGAVTATGFAPVIDLKIASGLGAVSATGFAPVIDLKIAAGLGAVDATGYAPVIDWKIAAGLGAVDVSGFAPSISVTENITVSSDLGALALTGFAPVLNSSISTDVGLLTLTGFEPSVDVSDNISVSAGLGEVSADGFVPVIDMAISCDFGELSLTGFEPTVTASDHQIVLAGFGEADLSGFAPSIDLSLYTDAGDLSLTGFAPEVTASDHQIVLAGAGACDLEGFAPDVTVGSFAGILRRWDGDDWVKAKLLTYTSSYEEKPLKMWTGADWEQVDVSG